MKKTKNIILTEEGEVLCPTLTWINTIVLQCSLCLLTSVSPNMLCDLTVELLLNVSYCVTAHKLVWLSLDMHQTIFHCCLIPDTHNTLYKWVLYTLFQMKFMILLWVIDISNDTLSTILGNLLLSEVTFVMRVRGQTQKSFLKTAYNVCWLNEFQRNTIYPLWSRYSLTPPEYPRWLVYLSVCSS